MIIKTTSQCLNIIVGHLSLVAAFKHQFIRGNFVGLFLFSLFFFIFFLLFFSLFFLFLFEVFCFLLSIHVVFFNKYILQ